MQFLTDNGKLLNSLIRQICFADFVYSHHPCLLLCVSFCTSMCCRVAKIMKNNQLYEFKHFQSKWRKSLASTAWPLPSFSKSKLCDFFLLWISCKLWELAQTLLLSWDMKYLPSNGTTVNVIHRDLDLHFQGHEFLIVNISIYQQISQTAIDSRKIQTDFQSGLRRTIQLLSFFPKILLPFPSFPCEVENK